MDSPTCMTNSRLDPEAPESHRPESVADPSNRHKDHRPVPIRTLEARHRHLIMAHLQALEGDDRYLRFGYAATDAQMARYVDSLDFVGDRLYGIFDRRLRLIAMAHLAYATAHDGVRAAEFGVSVLARCRGRGYGARLFERAAIHARNDGIDEMYIHALSENRPMLQIARNAGAVVVRHGSESEAHLHLPPANLDSRVTEVLQEQWAAANLEWKRQAWQFQRVLGSLGIDRH